MNRESFCWLLLLVAVGGVSPQCAGAAETKFDLERGLRVSSDDKRWQLDVDARVDGDAARFKSDVTPLPDQKLLRHARLGLALGFGRHVSARVDREFGKVSPGWKNVWLQYRFNDRFALRAGSQAVPFGLDEAAGSDTLMFTERALGNALAPGILEGVMLRAQGAHWGASAGLFGNDISNDDTRKMDGRSAIARLAFAPINEERTTFHLGASIEYRDANTGASVRYRSRPEIEESSVRLVDTGTLAAVSRLLTAEADMAWAPGAFTLQIEAVRSTVKRDLAGDLTFQGANAAVSFVFTGERRSYRVGTGSFGSIKPRHKWGAIELAARVSRLDLEDGTVSGGVEDNVTVALNWYWTRGSRLAIDYVKIHASPNRNGIDESPDALLLRLQLGF